LDKIIIGIQITVLWYTPPPEAMQVDSSMRYQNCPNITIAIVRVIIIKGGIIITDRNLIILHKKINFRRYLAQKPEPQIPLKRKATGNVSQPPQKEMRTNASYNQNIQKNTKTIKNINRRRSHISLYQKGDL